MAISQRSWRKDVFEYLYPHYELAGMAAFPQRAVIRAGALRTGGEQSQDGDQEKLKAIGSHQMDRGCGITP
jgi:hypothetical protein